MDHGESAHDVCRARRAKTATLLGDTRTFPVTLVKALEPLETTDEATPGMMEERTERPGLGGVELLCVCDRGELERCDCGDSRPADVGQWVQAA
jgi:hypothetical protein